MCSEMLRRCGGRDQNPTAGLATWWVIHNGKTEASDRCSCACVQSGVVTLGARQLFEFKPAAVAVFQRTAELAGRANGHTTACTAVLAHCKRHLANRRCTLNCWSQLVPLCEGNYIVFILFCSQIPNHAHNLQPGQAVSTHTLALPSATFTSTTESPVGAQVKNSTPRRVSVSLQNYTQRSSN